ncbi:putative Metallopeptidase (JCVI) [Aspergillus mulundensis]|uniref:Metallopeptidase, putative (JCVI) n=1 Tax=Aspergillus mulundensis TaxID=1810919 RepID=A0A3D8QIX2_9EURO|nr:Metallopeptidase, putative (JCVI) [Aspergillus mulundensis]RDW61755.1 Metallopeptidase, putative (JCVI) [Aspergillus mulundensis]
MSPRRPIYFNASAGTQSDFLEVEGLSKFHQSLAGYTPTPLTSFPDLATELGVRSVLVKDESNRLGLPSFKVLGASWGCYRAVAAYLDLPPTVSLEEMAARAQEKTITLLAATKGNHGRAVAFMARTLGIESNIFVPDSMDEPTQNRIRSEGAKVTIIKDDYDAAVLEALKVSKETEGALLIQDTALDGYEEVPSWIVDGYSTMMFEIESQLAEMGLVATTMITPVGVGSLANTVSTFCKSREAPISVVTVEPDTAACLQDSLLKEKLTPIETSFTIMDGMNCGTVSTTAWPNLQRLVDASVTVSCHESHKAVKYLALRSVSAGPCGAASLAALRRLTKEGSQSLLTKDSVVVLLSTEGPRDYPIPLDVSPDNEVEITRMLTKINSSNPTLSTADGAGETQICDYLQAWFAHRGIESHRVEPVPGRPSVVGVLRGTGGGKSLMFNGHIDTVSLASYETDALSGAVDTRDGQQVVLGRGSLDMKGGLASALATVSAIRAGSSLRGDIIVAAVSDEEDASQGTRDILAAGWKTDGAVIPEPTGEAMAHAHKGFVWVEVDILGVAAHGSDHVHGVDAILHTGRFLQAMAEYSKTLPVDDVLGPATLHCGLIKGGEEASSYPAKCTTTIEFRTVPGQTALSILNDIKSLLQDIQAKAGNAQFKFAEPRATLCRPAHKIDADHPFIQTVADCAETVMGKRPAIQSVPFWCDAALLSETGIPSVVFGPSGHGLHGKEEYVEVESLQRLKNVYEKLAREFCA